MRWAQGTFAFCFGTLVRAVGILCAIQLKRERKPLFKGLILGSGTTFLVLLGCCFIAVALFAEGCSRNPAVAVRAHHFDERQQNWIIELPVTATSQEVLSNYIGVLLLHDGKPVASDKMYMVSSAGKVVGTLNVPARRVGRYRIIEELESWCGGGISKDFVMETELGRKRVSIELARNHSDDPLVTGWRCDIYDSPTNNNWSAGTKYVQP
jgi:hypothetical protein